MNITTSLHKTGSVKPDEVRKWLKEKKEGEFVLLDVRQPAEYEKGHLPGAVLIPLPELPDRMDEVEAAKPVVLYCGSGTRSRSAASLMAGQGYSMVFNMEGGINAWNGLIASGQYDSGLHLFEGRKSLAEMISVASALEEGTGLFYGRLEKSSTDRETKEVFKTLVEAEKNHRQRLLDAYRLIKGPDSPDEIPIEESLGGIMEGGISIDNMLSDLRSRGRTLQDLLEISMQVETNSLDLYTKMIRETADPAVKEIFVRLVEEEKGHLIRLGRLLDSELDKA